MKVDVFHTCLISAISFLFGGGILLIALIGVPEMVIASWVLLPVAQIPSFVLFMRLLSAASKEEEMKPALARAK